MRLRFRVRDELARAFAARPLWLVFCFKYVPVADIVKTVNGVSTVAAGMREHCTQAMERVDEGGLCRRSCAY